MKDDRRPSGCLTAALVCLGVWMLLAWLMHWGGLMHGHWGLREVAAVPGWFEENREDILELRDLLMSHKAIRRVSPRQLPGHLRRYAEFSAADEAAYAEAVELIGSLRIAWLEAWRPDGRFESMDFALWADWEKVIFLHYNLEAPPHGFWDKEIRSLSLPGWYAYKYQP